MPEERTHTASSVEWNPHAITWIAYMVRSFIYNFHLYASNYTKHHFFVLFRCFVSSLIPHIHTSFCAHFQRSTPTPCSIDKLLIISMCFVWLFYYYYFFFASSTAQTVSILCTIKFLRNDSVKMLEFKVGKPNEKMKKRSGFVVVVCTSHSIFGTQQNLHRYFMLNRHIEMWRDFLLHWFATKDSHWKGKKIAYETKWIS